MQKTNRKLDTDKVRSIISSLYKDEYEIEDNYINNVHSLKILHKPCNTVYLSKPKYLLEFTGGLCPNCNSDSVKYDITLSLLKKRIKYIYNDKYTYIEGFDKKNKKKSIIKLQCKNCKKIMEVKITDIMRKPKKNLCGCNGKNYLIKDNYLQELLNSKSYGKEYKWLEDYKGNNKTKHKIKHLTCGNEYYVRPNDFQQGYKCPVCAHRKKASSYEDEIYDIIMENYKGTVMRNDRFGNYELDFYFVELKIGIEFNGYYWHSDKHVKSDHDVKKLEYFKKLGIDVYFINEIDYITKKEIIIDKILNLIKANLDKERIYARKCEVYVDIPVKEAKEFLNKNHIQGYSIAKYRFGLYYEDLLVGLMTFSFNRNNVNNKGKRLELVRYASNIDYIVCGGFSKILSYAEYYFTNEIELDKDWDRKIYSYADRCYSRGNVYEISGFKLDKICKESYFYVDKKENKRVNRYSMRKSELKKLLPDLYDDNLTEFQIIDKSSRYVRCYNCGNYLYSKEI